MLGGVLLLAFLALAGAMTAATTLVGEGRVVLMAATAACAVGVQFGL